MEMLRKKNVATEIVFAMVDSTSPETFKTSASVTDTGYSSDTDGTWTSLSITDTVTEIGSTGMYQLSLSSSEMNHNHIAIKLTATGCADTMIIINTYDNDLDWLAQTIDGTYTGLDVVRIMLAALAGKSTGGGTATLSFRDTADSKNRIQATVDSNGNRTAITLDGS